MKDKTYTINLSLKNIEYLLISLDCYLDNHIGWNRENSEEYKDIEYIKEYLEKKRDDIKKIVWEEYDNEHKTQKNS